MTNVFEQSVWLVAPLAIEMASRGLVNAIPALTAGSKRITTSARNAIGYGREKIV